MDLEEIIVSAAGKTARDGRSIIQLCTRYRVSCEGWWKLVLMHELERNLGIVAIPEKGHIDLTIQTSEGAEAYLELKTSPTNYGQSGRPITQFVTNVKKDISQLREKHPHHDHFYVACLVYPIPYPAPPQWVGHLNKITEDPLTVMILDDDIRLAPPSERAHTYVFRC